MRLFLHQLRGEQLLFWRTREAAIFVFVFPILLYVLVASVYTGRIDGRPAASVLLLGLLGYGVANTAFSGLAITLVVRREGGVLKRVRATPLPAATYFSALLASTVLIFAVQAVVLVLVARLAYSAALPSSAGRLAIALLLGTLCFAALGLATAALIRSSEGSSAIVNLILLPMAFLAGSFSSARQLPHVLRVVSELLPLRHLIDLTKAIALTGGSFWRPTDLVVLLAWGIAGLAVTVRRFGWEPRAA